nr:reverse transcriptase domain-containing protein [Tanacetum cinerariifolium]
MRTRSQSRHNSPQQEASPVILEPLRIELPFLEDQFQEDPPPEQRFDESFYEAWDRFNYLLRACPHHGFSELHQLDTFYNALNVNDQDSLNSTAGGNFLDKIPRECLKIIKSKSKVRQSRAKAVIAKVGTSSFTPTVSSEVTKLKDLVRALLLDKKNQSSALVSSPTPAPVKAVEPNCVTCDANYNQGNTGFRPQMVANQIRPPGFPPHQNNQNDFNRGNNFNQNRGGTKYAEPVPKYSKPVSKSANANGQFDGVLMLLHLQGTLPSNTITNPKEELKGITTRSGVAYQGPTNSTTSKVVKQGTEETLSEMARTPMNEYCSTVILNKLPRKIGDPGKFIIPCEFPGMDECLALADLDMSFEISFTDALILMPKFASTLKALIRNKEKLSEMARTPMNEHCLAVILNKLPRKLRDPDKFFIPCEFPGMDECLALADLGASINLMPFSVWEALSLSELTPTCMTLELADRSVSKPIGIAKDVSFKVGVFHFPANFMVVDFEPDPRVPLILERCFIKTGRALIDVHKGELTLRIENEAITYNLDQTEVLGFSDVTTSGNPTLHDDPIVSTTSPTLTPFGTVTSYSLRKPMLFSVCEEKTVKCFIDEPPEVELKDLPPHLEYAFLEGKNKLPVIIAKELRDGEKSALIKVLKSHKRAIAWKLSNIQATRKDHFPLPFMDQMLERLAGTNSIISSMVSPGTFQRCMLAIFHDMVEKMMEVFMDDFLVFGNSFENCLSRLDKMLQRCEDTNLSLNWEKGHFMVKEGIVLGHKISKDRIEVDRAKVNVIAKLPHPTTVKDCIKYFQTLKKKLTEAPILIAPNWDLPFELLCDASDFAIDAVLGQRHEKHFKPIHYASKTMNDAEYNYTTTEKEMLSVVYAFEKFQSYLIMNKSIVYTDHSTLKYLFAKKDAKARLVRWVLLFQEFDFKVLDTKGAENLAADHLSRLENPYENVLDPKGINETFPLETQSMVTFRGDSSAPWFADFAN